MTNTSIQMDLLSEVRTTQQVLNFAINRERGQANQQEIIKAHTNSTSWSQVSYIRNKPRPNFQQRTPQQPILPTPTSGKIEPCYKCGQPFIKNHLNMCKAQNFTCKICKKVGHFTSLCKAPMPERKNPQFRQNTRDYTHQQNTPQTRRVRHVKEQQNIEEDDEAENEETVDAEAALYIKELMEDWSSVNTVRPSGPDIVNNVALSKESGGEFWVNTKFNDLNLDWLADTGSPRSFIQYSKAQEIVDIYPESKITNFKEKTRYKCFNNQEIKILGVLQLTHKSGAWTARNCNILLVNNLPQNVMGRDILRQLGIQLTATKPTGKTIGLISDISTEQNIIKWIFKKYPHLCTRLGRSKNHMAKSIFKEHFTSTQHKGRRVPLHLLERVEQEN